MADALTVADLEKEFIAGEAGSEETAAYLEIVAADKFEAFLDAAADGSTAAVVDAVVAEAADLAEAQGLATDVEAIEEYAPTAAPDDGDDPLALYDNETAAGMRQLVAAAKLSPEELVEGMIPEVRGWLEGGGGGWRRAVCCRSSYVCWHLAEKRKLSNP